MCILLGGGFIQKAFASGEELSPSGDSTPTEQQITTAPHSLIQTAPPPKKAGVLLNFSGAELRQVLQVIHQKTGERFLFDEAMVEGKKVTFFSDRPIQIESLMPTLTSILEIQGLALVRVGRGQDSIYKVVTAKEASKKTTPTFSNDTMSLIPDSDEIITLLYRLNTLTPNTLVVPLGKMASIPDALTAIEGSRILKITDAAANVKRMIELIKVMDENDYKTVEEQVSVTHVLASTLVRELAPMIDVENQKLARELQAKMVKTNSRNKNVKVSPIVASRPLVVQAIDRLNAIYMNGTSQQIDAIKTMITSLDQPEQKRSQVHYIETQHRKPSDIIPALTLIYSKSSSTSSKSRRRSGPNNSSEQDVSFQADDTLGRLTVICPTSLLEDIKINIKTLDQPGEEGIVRPYPLTHVKAIDMEAKLKGLFTSQRSRRGSPSTYTIVRDDPNQSLIIRASELIHFELERSIRQLDIAEADQRNLKQYPLEFTEAENTAQLLANILGHPLGRSKKHQVKPSSQEVITVDKNANALMIMATKQGHLEIAKILQTLDKESKEKKVTQYYRLQHADPSDVSKNLRELYPQPRNRRGSEPDMSITIDMPSRTLVIKAEVGEQERIAETIAKLDIDGDDSRFMKSYQVKHVDPREASRILTEVIGAPQFSRWRRPPANSDIITVDSASSSILVFAQQSTQNKVLEAMTSIDVPNGDRYQTVFYEIRNADPNILYNNVREFFGSTRRRWGSPPELYLSLNAQARTLMVKALPEKQREVSDTIKKLDIGGSDPRSLKVYSLEYASPKDALRVLQGLLNLSTSGRLGRSSPNPYPDLISIDEANSSIVLFALTKTHETVQETLKQLDVESSAEEQIVYYRTRHLPILEAVRLLSEMFGFQAGTTRRSRGSNEKLILDENSNTMIITASPRTHAKVREVLKEVDVSGLGENEMRFYPIENTTALDAARMIEQLFGLPSKAPRNQSTGERGLPLQRNPMVIPNIESNTLIINAPEKTHRSIEDMLKSLSDISKVDKMTVRFYPLENTNATDIAGQISELFSLKLGTPQKEIQQKGRNVSSSKKSSGGAILRPLRPEDESQINATTGEPLQQPMAKTQSDRNAFFFDGEPTVIPEINLNSIILVAPSYLHEEVKRTLETMDKRRPQVMIEVAIVEVSGGSDLDFGVEWSYLGTDGAVNTPFGIKNLNTAAGSLPTQNVSGTALEGVVAGVLRSNGTMPVILNAVQQDKRMKIRSTPVLLVNDNEEAQFASLQEEPTTSTTQSNSSTAISFNGFVEAGTALTITPHISQGEYIRLEVDLKVESFTASAISPGIPPPKSSSTLKTSVTVPDRQMVIVGGMVSEQTADLDKKVPILGDIPVLGNLFKRTEKGKTQSKLYLFISPKILRDESFEDLKSITLEKTNELEVNSQKPMHEELELKNSFISRKQTLDNVQSQNAPNSESNSESNSQPFHPTRSKRSLLIEPLASPRDERPLP
jgi:type II secretion system protein D